MKNITVIFTILNLFVFTSHKNLALEIKPVIQPIQCCQKMVQSSNMSCDIDGVICPVLTSVCFSFIDDKAYSNIRDYSKPNRLYTPYRFNIKIGKTNKLFRPPRFV